MSAFEKAMASTAKAFSKVDERFNKIDEKLAQHDKAFALLLKQMQVFTEEGREHRQTMATLMHTDISQERNIENLRVRVERLETRAR